MVFTLLAAGAHIIPSDMAFTSSAKCGKRQKIMRKTDQSALKEFGGAHGVMTEVRQHDKGPYRGCSLV